MTLNLTKPSAGATGWAAAMNQNLTDIESAVNGVVTEATSTSVTGSWTTNTTYSCFAHQHGDQQTLRVRISTSGAPNAGTTLTITPPVAVDESKLPVGSGFAVVGYGFVWNQDTFSIMGSPITVVYDFFNNVFQPRWNSSGALFVINPTNPITFGSGDYIELHITVPVA